MDYVYKDIILNKIAFGSCNKQWKNQSFWQKISLSGPQIWIWTGDSYYTSRKQFTETKTLNDGISENDKVILDAQGVDALRHAQQNALKTEEYREFLSTLQAPPLGTYDDHDFGVNDGGKHVKNKEIRKEIFLDFLNVPQDSYLRKRDGVYSSALFGEGQHRVKVILLDTRYSRDDLILPNFNTLSTITNSLARLFSVATGIYRFHEGVIMDQEQWTWLRDQLVHSQENGIPINILVSSIQVFTPNPLVESWMHFPQEKKRLIDLLLDTKPRGLILISGDVHIGLDNKVSQNFYETTSSGLTHDCSDGGIPKLACQIVWSLTSGLSSAFIGQNFGTIAIDWESGIYNVAILNLNGGKVLDHTGQVNSVLVDSSFDFAHDNGSTLIFLVNGFLLIAVALVVKMIVALSVRGKKAKKE